MKKRKRKTIDVGGVEISMIPLTEYSEENREDAHYFAGQAEGAYLNGSRVVKVKTNLGDKHPVGALATVLSSIGPMDEGPLKGVYGYFVIWDDIPNVPTFVTGNKLAPYDG